ncbi:MAG: glycosyltransferase family 2 protein [Anaerolineaceae bacterium]|nr:glycosyltransferase family 2 protein [Anaerolineaceae bacterium]
MSASSILVSVVIPAYNALPFLDSTVASVEAQSYRDYEIIIIDDGSTDGTVEWAASNQGRFRYVTQANQGQGAARNHGAELAQGEFLAFLDADDMWLPSKLEMQVEALSCAPQYSFAFTDGFRLASSISYKELDRPNGDLPRLSSLISEPASLHRIEHEFRMHCVPTSSIFLRKKNYWSAGGMPLMRQGEDFVLCCRLLINSPAVYIDEPLTYYRIHQNNISAVVRGKKDAIGHIRRKDRARMYLSQACAESENVPDFVKQYARLPFVLRLWLLLWWRFQYGSSKKKIMDDIFRYIKV